MGTSFKPWSVLAMTLFLFNTTAQAQNSLPPDLGGARIGGTGGSTTSATFAVGLSHDGGATFGATADTDDNIAIVGFIRPEASQIGQHADLFIVALVGGTYYMRNQSGGFIPWTFGDIGTLVPSRTNQTLTASVELDIYSGPLPITGNHLLFLGYRTADNTLYYTPVPQPISITIPVIEPPPDPREQAIALFNSTISPDVVQTVCIECHVDGGQADGLALHLFVRTSNPNHLDLNFDQLENLLNARGRIYILNKVTGGAGHIGGTVLLPSMQEYRDLDSFLQLLEE